MPCFWVYITAADRAEAARMGDSLLQARLAACVNILGPIESRYWWKGKLESASEVAMIAKTTATRLPKLIAHVKSVHSYEVPCVVALPIADGNPDFLRWIRAATASAAGKARRRKRSRSARRE
jgi:periplasmic divalent cation tolerance protein